MDFGPRVPAGLSAEKVSRTFRRSTVLAAVSLSLEPGTIAALMGPNGSGKTTLLRILAGVLEPDSGSIRVAGAPPGKGLAAYVPAGDRALYWRLTAKENLEFFARIGGSGGNRKELAEEAAARLGATDLLRRRVGTLSIGQRRRIMIARGLVARTPVVLLDEPFADLDDAGCAAVEQVARGWADAGGTVVYAAPGEGEGPSPDVRLRLGDEREQDVS